MHIVREFWKWLKLIAGIQIQRLVITHTILKKEGDDLVSNPETWTLKRIKIRSKHVYAYRTHVIHIYEIRIEAAWISEMWGEKKSRSDEEQDLDEWRWAWELDLVDFNYMFS